MSGEELYQLWVDANERISCTVDEWRDLDEAAKAVFNHMAKRLELANIV